MQRVANATRCQGALSPIEVGTPVSPDAPSQIPACGITAPGSSGSAHLKPVPTQSARTGFHCLDYIWSRDVLRGFDGLANTTATLGSFYWLGFETTGLSPDKKRLAWLGAQRRAHTRCAKEWTLKGNRKAYAPLCDVLLCLFYACRAFMTA